MNRREFISLLGGAAVGALTWPLGARAQERAVTLIGFLHTRSRDAFTNLAGFLKALGEAGYVDGQSIFIDYRFVDGQYDRLPAMAAESGASLSRYRWSDIPGAGHSFISRTVANRRMDGRCS
jgi:putative tryptophan/tyrosine transport system substrate-binding protein